jgi:hypothetical protein
MADAKEKAAARKRASRERQQQSGFQKFELILDSQEIEMLRLNCAARRPGRDPYEMAEYLSILIRRDHVEVKEKLSGLTTCKKCGDKLPVNECCFSGDHECWLTLGWHDLKLTV